MVRVSERAAALKAAVVWLALHLPASQDSFDIQVLIQPHRRVLGKNSSNKGISWYITEKKTQSIAWHSAPQRVVVGSTPAVPPPNHSHQYQISYTELLIVLVFLWPPWTEASSEVSESHEESPEDSLDTTLGFDLSTTFTSLVPSIQGWQLIPSKLNLSLGSVFKHPSIRSFKLWDKAVVSLQSGSPITIWVSVSKGMSPHTRSCNKMPMDHTVRPSAVYRRYLIHSGGA